MADAPAYVGLQSQPPDVLGRLSQLLQIRGQQASVQQTEQDTRQRQALAKYDYGKHVGEDGTFDLNSVAADPELRAAAGDYYIDTMAKVATAKQMQLEAKSKLFALRGDQVKALGQTLGPLLSDQDVVEGNDRGKQKVNEAWMQYALLHGEEALPVLAAYAPAIKNAPPEKLAQTLRMIQMQATDAGAQIDRQMPQYGNTGRDLKNLNPLATPGSARDIPLTIAPGAQAVLETDQLENPYLVYRDARGNIIGTAPMGGGENGPARFGVGERDTFEKQAQSNFENVTSNRNAAAMAPQQIDQINKALDLSKQVSTGAWAAKRAQIESGIGSLIPGFEGMDDASKLQELDKFAERIATDASKVLGVNAKTDAERESIHKQNANIGYTPQAIQAVLKYAKAQTLAMQAKGDAQEEFLKGNKITKQHEFETEFRKAYDPRIFQFEVMSQKEQEDFLRSLSKEDRKDIKEKTKALIDMGAIRGD
jgi:hypothetical protein